MPSYLTDPGLWNKGGGLFGGVGFSGRPGDIPSMADRYGKNWRKKLVRRGGGRVGGGVVQRELSVYDEAKRYSDMLNKQQQSVLNRMLDDANRRRQGEMASLAGFGAALQGYSSDLWGQTASGYQNAAAQQQSAAQGLGGQVGQGLAEAHAQQAALGGSLGYTGGTDLATPEAGAAQVASEGGAKTGEMMGQVGTAWGGYGATRPEYIGFMTGQNQMQLAREGIEADKDLRSKFLELGMGNMEQGLNVALKLQEVKSAKEASKLDKAEASWKRLQDNRQYGLDLKQQALVARELGIKDKQFWADHNAQVAQWNKENQVDWANVNVARENAKTSRINATTGGSDKAGTAYNSMYGKLYSLAQGGNNSPLYNRVDTKNKLGPNPTPAEVMAAIADPTSGVKYVKKARPAARAALLARAQPFINLYPDYRKQVMSDIEMLLDTMGFGGGGGGTTQQSAPPTEATFDPDNIFGSFFPGMMG